MNECMLNFTLNLTLNIFLIIYNMCKASLVLLIPANKVEVYTRQSCFSFIPCSIVILYVINSKKREIEKQVDIFFIMIVTLYFY